MREVKYRVEVKPDISLLNLYYRVRLKDGLLLS